MPNGLAAELRAEGPSVSSRVFGRRLAVEYAALSREPVRTDRHAKRPLSDRTAIDYIESRPVIYYRLRSVRMP